MIEKMIENYSYIVWWVSVEGIPHTDYFVPLTSQYAKWDVSYVHKCNDTKQAVRDFISTLPLAGLRVDYM